MCDDVADRAQSGDLGLVHLRKAGNLFLQCGEDFDALDGINAEVCFKSHRGLQHLFGIASLLGDQSKKNGLNVAAWRSDHLLIVDACRERGACSEVVNNVGDRPQPGNLCLVHFRKARHLFLQCGEDFDALDGVNAKVGFKGHGGFQHLFGVTGFVRNQS